jgi:DNA-binding NtrC family response regulator
VTRFSWPGNVRELQTVIERAVVLANGPVVQIDDSLLQSEAGATEASAIDTLENNERNHILRALNVTNWVVHGKKARRTCSASIQAHCARAWKSWGSRRASDLHVAAAAAIAITTLV